MKTLLALSGGVVIPNMEVTSSADKLIGEIREMYNVSRKNAAQLSCNLIDHKLARRELAKKERLRKEWCWQSATDANSTKTSRPVTSSKIITDDGRASASDKNIALFKGHDKAHIGTVENGGNMSCCASIARSAFPGKYPPAVKAVQRRRSGLPKVFNALGDDTPRIIGEIAFQLERRIIAHVFPDADQMYYGTLNDIRRVIGSEPDEEIRARYARALHCRMQRLEPLGWDVNYHVDFGNRIMAKYGVGAPAFFYVERDPLAVHAQLARLIAKKLPLVERIGMTTILSGLLSLAMEDERGLFLTTEGEEFAFM